MIFLEVNNTKLEVKVTKKKRLKHLYFSISKDTLEVRCNNNITKKELLNILNQNISIIEKKHKNALSAPTIEEFDQILYLGTPLPLKITIDNSLEYESYKLNDNNIELNLTSELTKEKKEFIRDLLYKNNAPLVLKPRFYYWQNVTNLEANRVSFRKAKSKWGSCSNVNNISLNSRLLMLPQSLSDYVIVHELAHIVHKNHSKEFWALVEKFYPNYKEARKELKIYGSLLT